MIKSPEKPSPEAKALSIFLMAYKAKNPSYKESSKRINRLWADVKSGELEKEDYIVELKTMLAYYGGYEEIVEKTVRFYIEKTGEWTLNGDDKYCQDAKEVANRIKNH